MARDHTTGSQNIGQDILNELNRLRERLERLEGQTTTTLQQIAIADIDDPIEGQEVIDHTDNKHKWYSDGAWRVGGGGGVAVALAVGNQSINHNTWGGFDPVTFNNYAISDPTYFSWNASGFLEIIDNGMYQVHTTFKPAAGTFGGVTSGVVETQNLIKDAANASQYYGMNSIEALPSLGSYWSIDESGSLTYQVLKNMSYFSFYENDPGEFPLRVHLELATTASGTHTASFTMAIVRLMDQFDSVGWASNS